MSIGPLKVDEELICDDLNIGNALQDQYKNVFSVPRPKETDVPILEDSSREKLDAFVLSEGDIEWAISKISTGAAPGPDGIPSILLKKCARAVKQPLCLLWQRSISSGQIPESLKKGLIIPVFKSGDRCEAKNYRPVTLTSHFIKIFERILVRIMVEYLEKNDLFNNSQHGFRSNRSCLSQLINHYQHLLNILEEGACADVIYLDFAKAFDKVDHGILLRKIFNMGIGGDVLRWIGAFLRNRWQSVKVNNSMSRPTGVVSGVPQGSVLGPLLFLIFVGDIDTNLVHARASSFADDTRIMMGVTCTEHERQMQRDLDSIYRWTDNNNMKFNCSKFQHMRYGHKEGGELGTVYSSPDTEPIDLYKDIRDLGVTMSCNGKFEVHISEICTKGIQMSGWIFRAFATRKIKPLMIL